MHKEHCFILYSCIAKVYLLVFGSMLVSYGNKLNTIDDEPVDILK